MVDQLRKPGRRRATKRGPSLPWDDPSVDDVQDWLREALDNVESAESSAQRRVSRGDDAYYYTRILLASWSDPKCEADATPTTVLTIFSRAERVTLMLLNADFLPGSSTDRACNVKAAEKLVLAMTELSSDNAVRAGTAEEMIAGLRRTAIAAARFAAAAGAAAMLETPFRCGGGTYAEADAAYLASVLYRTADHNERYLSSLH